MSTLRINLGVTVLGVLLLCAAVVGGCYSSNSVKKENQEADGSDSVAGAGGGSAEGSPDLADGEGSTEGSGGSGFTEKDVGAGGSNGGEGETGGDPYVGSGVSTGGSTGGSSVAGAAGIPPTMTDPRPGVIPPFVGAAGGFATGGQGQPPQDCTPAYRSNGGDYCDIEYECATGYLYTWCETYDPERWYCTCDSMNGFQEFELTNVSAVGDPCAFVGDLCTAEGSTQIEFTGPPQCSPSYQEFGLNYCSIEQTCTQSAEISDGVTVMSSQWQYTWCEISGETWTCSCETGGSTLTFDIPQSTAAAEVCPRAVDICSAGTVEMTGPRECSPTFQSASPDWCDAQHDCTRTASIDGTEVQAHEWLYTSCYLEAESQWTCDCGVGAQSMSFDLSNPDAWTTCQQASADCVDAFASGQ